MGEKSSFIGGDINIISVLLLKNLKSVKPVYNYQWLGSIHKSLSKMRRYEVFFCSKCSKDPELHHKGWFISSSTKGVEYNFSSSCGCSNSFRHTDKTAKVVLGREAIKRCYTFIDFVGGNFTTLMKTKVRLNCSKHGEWSSCTAANFLKNRGCPSCAYDIRSSAKVKTDKLDKLTRLADKRGFTVVTEIAPTTKNKDRIDVRCHTCNFIFDLTVCNFMRGRGCPSCSGKNQKFLYLNVIRDLEGNNTDYLKIGITNNLSNRLESQNLRNLYKMFHMHTWEFKDTKDCKSCEKFIKQKVVKGKRPIDKSVFKDGYSEIVHTSDYMDVMDIVYDFNGREIISCEIIERIEEMFKYNIIK